MPADLPSIPAWLIEQVVESLPLNAYAHGDVHQAIQVRRAIGTSIAVQVWHDAFHAGATWGMSIVNGTKYMVVTAGEKKRIEADFRPAGHAYLSTGCLHGEHGYCQSMTGLNGSKRPGECKFCQAKCTCDCHKAADDA